MHPFCAVNAPRKRKSRKNTPFILENFDVPNHLISIIPRSKYDVIYLNEDLREKMSHNTRGMFPQKKGLFQLFRVVQNYLDDRRA
jgi:hypothetical protein